MSIAEQTDSAAEHPSLFSRGRRLNESDKKDDKNDSGASSLVWQHNAWDDLHWTSDMEADAERIVATQQQQAQQKDEARLISIDALEEEGRQWDSFYRKHDRWFFKDRKWLKTEFPDIFLSSSSTPSPLNILEVGCGAGNTVFPVLRNTEEHVKVYACDFSEEAVGLVRTHREYSPNRLTVFQHDLSSDAPFSFEENSDGAEAPVKMDIVIAIFVLSAIHPSRLPFVLDKLHRVLAPGGLFLFRDYGRMDLTQLRLPASRFVCKPDCYRRGDGTLVHYFTEAECREELFADSSKWAVTTLQTDRRLIVNRKRQLLMRRVWIQGKFEKKK